MANPNCCIRVRPPNRCGGEPFALVRTASELRCALLYGGIIIVQGEITASTYFEIIKDGTQIWGYNSYDHGRGKVIIDNDSENQHVFFVNADDVLITGLDISGAQAFPSVAGGPDVGNHNGIRIARTVTNPKGQRLRVERCHIHNLFKGIDSAGAADAGQIEGIKILNNKMYTFSHTGIHLTWNLISPQVIGNLVDFRRAGETHIKHPDYASTGGNCVFIGNDCYDVETVLNRTQNAYERWGIELLSCFGSRATHNKVHNCGSGLSLGNGECNIAAFNEFTGIDGASGASEVGVIEVVGSGHQVVHNHITDGGKICPYGIVVQGGSNSCVIAENFISGVEVPVIVNAQAESRDIFIDENTVVLNTRVGEDAFGISLNNQVADDKLRSIYIRRNTFIGSVTSTGAILIQNSLDVIVDKNIQKADFEAGESATANTVFVVGTSRVYTDAENDVFQTAAGFIYQGTNIRTDDDGVVISSTKVITPGATTGSQTINAPNGSVNFAALATSLTVTNSLVHAGSVIVVSLGTVDATAVLGAVVAGSGSFVINMATAPTGETKVYFSVR